MLYVISFSIFILLTIGSSAILRSVKEQPIESRRLRKLHDDLRFTPHHYQRLAAGLVIEVAAIIIAMILQSKHHADILALILPAGLITSLALSIALTWKNGTEGIFDRLVGGPISWVAKLGPINLLARSLSKRNLLDPRHIDTPDELLLRLESQIRKDKGTISEDDYQKIRGILKGDARTVINIAHSLIDVPTINLPVKLTPKLVDDIRLTAFHGVCLVRDSGDEIIGVCSPGILATTLMTGGQLDDRFIEPIISISETETISNARNIMREWAGNVAILADSKNNATAIISVNDLLIV
jgi:CBS domain containing-hemolysin-like protein